MSAPLPEPGFTVQGWCPGALRPMASGDGLVVRLRPYGGRLTEAQAAGIAAASLAHGNGLIDLSARGNVQLRGVREDSHAALIADLRRLSLIDADPLAEARRNLLVTPFAGPQTDALATRLARALEAAPDLPGKFGFAVDSEAAPALADISADIRLERAVSGDLILRCDGAALGAPVSEDEAPDQAVALAQWFVGAGGVVGGRGRMAALVARGILPGGPLAPRWAPAPSRPAPGPGLCPQGALLGFDFGQMQAAQLLALSRLGPLRITPWRMVLVEGLSALPDLPGLILRADDPMRRVIACTGAPGCLQAHRPVRDLARLLAPQVRPGRLLHLSGCAKGCAHPGAADVTLVATRHGFDLVLGGTSQDTPAQAALADPETALKGLL